MTAAPPDPVGADVAASTADARAGAAPGAPTGGQPDESGEVVGMLNAALATELVGVLRYWRHHAMTRGVVSGGVAARFLTHATEELCHADLLATRIIELDGAPSFDPASLLARSFDERLEAGPVLEMVREDLLAARSTADLYLAMITWLGRRDPPTRRLLHSILVVEERHVAEMADLLLVRAPDIVDEAPDRAATPDGRIPG